MEHWQNYFEPWMHAFGLKLFFGGGVFILFIFVAWSIYWKGRSLWQAAQRGQKIWFVTLLIVNTLGILEILYLYVFSKRKESNGQSPELEK